MDVFVIPVGRDRYELYCESASHLREVGGEPARGVFGRLWRRFNEMLHLAEEEYRRGDMTRDAPGLRGRLQGRAVAWMAQRIAEQRLLWNLRGETTATASHPQDMAFDQVLVLIRRSLQRDYDRHRTWMIIDGLLFAVTGVLLGPFFLLVPGIANIPAMYFGFRFFGHWLSMRGAARGLHGVRWTGQPCPPLSELRDVVMLEAPARRARVHDIAARLRLQHLSAFFDRVTLRHA
jgi:hypothetical protein